MIEHPSYRRAPPAALAARRVADMSSRTVMQLAPALAVLAPPLIYAALFKIYRPWNEDNAWFVSFSHNLCERDTLTDAVFGRVFPNGMGGTVAFGRVPALLHCALLRPLHWSLSGAYAVSLAVFAATCALLYVLVRGRGWSRSRAGHFVALIALLEPFVALANAAKYEFVILFLATFCLVLHQRGRLVAAGCAALLALECEPIGVVASLYLVCAELEAVLQRGRISVERVLWLLLGAGLGALCILLLHPDFPSQLVALAHAGEQGPRGHFLYPYFFTAKYLRHLPELLIILWVLGDRLLRQRLRLDFALLAMLAVFMLGLISYRANYHYAVFFLLPASLMVYEWLSERHAAPILFFIALLVMVPQYAMVIRLNGAYRNLDHLAAIRGKLEAAVDPKLPLTVYGHYSSFFPLCALDFRVDEMLITAERPRAAQEALVCLTNPTPDLPPSLSCAQLLPHFSGARRVGSVPYGAHAFDILLRTQR